MYGVWLSKQIVHSLLHVVLYSVRVKHVCRAENLSSAIRGSETFCDTCKKKGVQKKTSTVYCTKGEKKYCAKHAEVSVGKAKIVFFLFLFPVFIWRDKNHHDIIHIVF